MAKRKSRLQKVPGHVSSACAAWEGVKLPAGWDRNRRLSEFQFHVLVLRAFEAGYRYGRRKQHG